VDRSGEPERASEIRLRCESSVLAQEPTGAAFSLAAGALVREADPESLRIDLVPPAYVEEHAKSRRKQRIIYLSFAIFLALTVGFVAAKKVLDDKKSQLAELETEISDIKERVSEIKRKQMVVSILRDYTSLERSPLAILDHISQWDEFFAGDRPRVCIESFDYRRDKVTLTGWAQTYPDLDAFEANLKKTGFFEEVSGTRHGVAAQHARHGVKFTALDCIFKTQKENKK
jgi:Tfp pilus assembly protein PilN